MKALKREGMGAARGGEGSLLRRLCLRIIEPSACCDLWQAQ
jgi:hypothetical protein